MAIKEALDSAKDVAKVGSKLGAIKKFWKDGITLKNIMKKHFELEDGLEEGYEKLADFYELDPDQKNKYMDKVNKKKSYWNKAIDSRPKGSWTKKALKFGGEVLSKVGDAAGLISDIFAIKNALDFLRAPHEDTNLGGAQAMLDRFSRILRDYNIGKMVYNNIFTHEESNSSSPLHKTQNLLKLLPSF